MAAIISPIPGIFYQASAPGKDPYVQVGDTVEVGQVVALVEVMKQFTEIKSEVAGTVEKILVADSSPVAPGMPLFEIKEN